MKQKRYRPVRWIWFVRSAHFLARYRRNMHAKAPPPIPQGTPATSPTKTAAPRFFAARARNTRTNPPSPESRMIGTSAFSILIVVCFITSLQRPNYLFRRKEFGLNRYWPRNAELLGTALHTL